MVSSRFRAILLLVVLFLAAQSLGARSDLAPKIEDLCAPFRAVAAIAAPLGWISHGEAWAAERNVTAGEEARRAAARALLAAAESSAAPSERALAEGKGLLHAEVVEHVDGDPDRLVVRFASGAGVRRGMPVVCGDDFVGRVVSVDEAEAGLARVDLVTRRDFRVGAEIVHGDSPKGAPVQVVVGGVLPRGVAKEVVLEARTPHGKATGGEVRVLELERKDEDPYRTLANGFRLGTLVFLGDAVRKDSILGVRPALDFKPGFLSHVGILCPSEHAPAGLDLARDPFSEEHWVPARFALAGTASFWRETRALSRPSISISDGAAVVLGSNLLGCVESPFPERAPSHVALLGDPGFEVAAMASPVPPTTGATTTTDAPTAAGDDAKAAVIPIGKLVSLGRNRRDGTLRLRWDPSVRALAERSSAPTEVILYTASGRRSVPPGLVIGRTLLPDARRGVRGPFVLSVRQEETGLSIAEVRVWCDRTSPGGEPGP